jgi:hypothetical protein
VHFWQLQDLIVETYRVVFIHGSLVAKRKDSIQIRSDNWYEYRSFFFGFNVEQPIEFADEQGWLPCTQ